MGIQLSALVGNIVGKGEIAHDDFPTMFSKAVCC